MGLFGCSHRWKKYGRANGGTQQHKCSRCGRLKNSKAQKCSFGSHRWKMDRQRKPPVFVCRQCGKTRPARQLAKS